MPENEDEITFEDVGAPEAPPIQDPQDQQLERDIIDKIERKQREEAIKGDLGLTPEPPSAPVPKEIPGLIFRFAAKSISCPKFELDDEESRVLAKHLSIICEALKISGWMWSIVVVLMVIISKVLSCWDAIVKKFSRTEAAP